MDRMLRDTVIDIGDDANGSDSSSVVLLIVDRMQVPSMLPPLKPQAAEPLKYSRRVLVSYLDRLRKQQPRKHRQTRQRLRRLQL